MRVGLSMPLPAYTIDPAFMGRTAELLGFESIWYAEHPAVPVSSATPFPATGGSIPLTYSHFTEPYIALARASAVTTTLKLATGITLVPQRNPPVLAKEIAALDHHSGAASSSASVRAGSRRRSRSSVATSPVAGRRRVRRSRS